MAPPGTRALVYTDPIIRLSWETHSKDGWYVGIAPKHYRCFWFLIPATQGFCNAHTATSFPSYCKMPHEIKQDKTIKAATNLIDVIQKIIASV